MKRFLIFFLLIFIGCSNQDKRITTIEKLTKIDFPKQSKLIRYEDNYELQLSYKIETDRSSLNEFIKLNSFKVYYYKDMLIEPSNIDDELIRIVEQDFEPKEHITKSKNLYIYHKKNIVIIADKNLNIIWGIITYSD